MEGNNRAGHVIDEFEVYRSRAYSFAGGCLLDVKHTSLNGVSQSNESLPGILRQFFVFEKDVTIPCGKATRVDACGKRGSGEKHRVRLVSEGSIEKSDMQQLKSVNFRVNTEESTDVTERESSRARRVSRSARMSLPTNLLHTGHESRRSRTPSPSHTKSKTSLLQSKARRPCELPMDSYYSTFRPRTRSMPSRSRATKLQHKSFTVAEGYLVASGEFRHQGILNTGDDLETEAIYRVRSFSTSGKTVINRGDSFKSCTTSSGHASIGGSVTSIPGEDSYFTQSRTSSVSSQGDKSDSSSCGIPPPMYKVLMLGTHGVGKSSLAQQFTTSEYMGHVDTFPGKSV